MSRCNCCHCKAERKESKELREQLNPKCLNKNCPGRYVRTDRMDKGLWILKCNVCGEEGV